MISVIMSVYSEPLEWIQESIDSILQQTFNDFEFIIINDNPNRQELYAFLQRNKAKDKRIDIINNSVNIGLTKSLNIGVGKAQGKFIARMDADDISVPCRFEKQLQFLNNNPGIGVCGSSIQLFGEQTGVIRYPVENDEMFLFIESCFAHPTVMARSDIFKSNKYNESIKVAQDYDLWTTLKGLGVQFGNIKDPLLHYRRSKIQISSSKRELQMEVSRQIRRRAFDDYCKHKNVDFEMSDKPITYALIDEINQIITLPDVILRTLNFYLLLSIRDNVIKLSINMLRYRFFHKLRFYDAFRIYYHSLRHSFQLKF